MRAILGAAAAIGVELSFPYTLWGNNPVVNSLVLAASVFILTLLFITWEPVASRLLVAIEAILGLLIARWPRFSDNYHRFKLGDWTYSTSDTGPAIVEVAEVPDRNTVRLTTWFKRERHKNRPSSAYQLHYGADGNLLVTIGENAERVDNQRVAITFHLNTAFEPNLNYVSQVVTIDGEDAIRSVRFSLADTMLGQRVPLPTGTMPTPGTTSL